MNQGPAQLIALPRPHQPADAGVSALGIVMLLASSGGLLLAGALLLLGVQRDSTPLVIIGALAAVRALYHRRAAMSLASGEGEATGHLGAYVVVGGVHSLAMGTLLAATVDLGTAIHVAALLLTWPAILRVVYRRQRGRAPLPAAPPEDLGVGAVAVTLTVLGAVGLALALLVLLRIIVIDTGGVGVGLFSAGFAALALRAVVRLRAGLIAQRLPPTRACGAVAIDLHLSLPTSIAIATLTWAGLSLYAGPLAGVLGAALAAWATLDWPLAIHRVLSIRRFDHHVAGDGLLQAVPDRGRSALGWMLLLVGATTAVHAVCSMLFAPSLSATDLQVVLAAGGHHAVELLTRTPWWNLAAGGAAAIAGAALVRADARAPLLAKLFSLITTGAIVFDWLPNFRALSADWADVALSSALAFQLRASALIELAVAIALVAATWLIAARSTPATGPARARLR